MCLCGLVYLPMFGIIDTDVWKEARRIAKLREPSKRFKDKNRSLVAFLEEQKRAFFTKEDAIAQGVIVEYAGVVFDFPRLARERDACVDTARKTVLDFGLSKVFSKALYSLYQREKKIRDDILFHLAPGKKLSDDVEFDFMMFRYNKKTTDDDEGVEKEIGGYTHWRFLKPNVLDETIGKGDGQADEARKIKEELFGDVDD